MQQPSGNQFCNILKSRLQQFLQLNIYLNCFNFLIMSRDKKIKRLNLQVLYHKSDTKNIYQMTNKNFFFKLRSIVFSKMQKYFDEVLQFTYAWRKQILVNLVFMCADYLPFVFRTMQHLQVYNHSTNLSLFNHFIIQSFNHSIVQSFNHASNQSIVQSFNQAFNQSFTN